MARAGTALSLSIVAAGLLVAVQGGSASADPNGGGRTHLPPINNTVLPEGTALSAAERAKLGWEARIHLTDTVAAAREHYNTRFGGAWITDNGGSPMLDIGIVGLGPNDQSELISLFSERASSIHLVPVKYSLATLLGYQRAIEQIWTTSSSKHKIITDWADAASNRVIVLTRSDAPDILATISATVPADAVTFRHGSGTMRPLDSRDTALPHEAGRNIASNNATRDVVENVIQYCTSAYIMVDINRAIGNQFFGSTAGHCTYDGDIIHASDETGLALGPATDNDWYRNKSAGYTSSDHALIELTPDYYAAGPYLYVNSGLTRFVTGQINQANDVDGTTLCSSARTTSVVCGTTNIQYGGPVEVEYFDEQDLQYEYITEYNSTCWTGLNDHGDSGGPVYQPSGNNDALAVGIISYGYFDDNGNPLYSCFDPIDNVEYYSGFQLYTTNYPYPAAAG